MENINAFLAKLPNQPGVYQMFGQREEIIYVGKARNLKKRVSSYFNKSAKDDKTQALVKQVNHIEIIVTHSETEALLLESNLIKKYKPHYNVLFRDDKSYPYIMITDHAFPQIDIYRGHKKSKGRFFGPYPNATAVRETIHVIQKLFHLRTCTDSFYAKRLRPCLLHQIGKCSGPCVGLISKEEYQKNVGLAILFLEGKSDRIINELEKQMERASAQLDYELAARFRDQISQLRIIQERQYVTTERGDSDVIALHREAGLVCIQLLVIRGGRILGSRSFFPNAISDSADEEILTAFITQHYLTRSSEDVPKEILINKNIPERPLLAKTLSEYAKHKITISASVRGDRKKWLEIALINAKQVLIQQSLSKSHTSERFQNLASILDMDKPLKRIECFDISHTMGEETVASCVVFNIDGPLKSDYRRFNIRDITAGNDVAAMEQVLRRRFSSASQAQEDSHPVYPDIILIDGGKAQLNAAQKVLNELGIKTIQLVGVAKGVTRKPGFETLFLPDQPGMHLSPDSPALHLIQQIRDEAHRFAITGHRLRRDKKRRTSMLESIPGIGSKRRRELLRYFGGIQGLKHASLEEIQKVPGMSQALAQKVFDVLHG